MTRSTTITLTGADIGTLNAFLANAAQLGERGAIEQAPVAGLLQATEQVRRLADMLEAELLRRG